MAHFADRFALGEIRRGIVNMPPRHGKSRICSTSRFARSSLAMIRASNFLYQLCRATFE